MPTQKEELQLNTQQDMSSEDMYVLKKLFTDVYKRQDQEYG